MMEENVSTSSQKTKNNIVDEDYIQKLSNNLTNSLDPNSLDLNSIMQFASSLLKTDNLYNSIPAMNMNQTPIFPITTTSTKKEPNETEALSQQVSQITKDIHEIKKELHDLHEQMAQLSKYVKKLSKKYF